MWQLKVFQYFLHLEYRKTREGLRFPGVFRRFQWYPNVSTLFLTSCLASSLLYTIDLKCPTKPELYIYLFLWILYYFKILNNRMITHHTRVLINEERFRYVETNDNSCLKYSQ